MHQSVVRIAFILAGILLPGCASSFKARSTYAPPHPIVEGCKIIDTQGVLAWSYPSQFCLFLSDGRFISANIKGITFHSAEGRTLWHRDMPVHHMMNFAANGDILLLSQERIQFQDWPHKFEEFCEARISEREFHSSRNIPKRLAQEELRVDKIVRLNMNGETVAEKRFLGGPDYPLPTISEFNFEKTHDIELSHMNSLYEISSNSSKLAAFKAGNIIINDTMNRRIFVMDAQLKNVVWQVYYGLVGFGGTHDVQVLPNGNLLIFKNFSIRSGDPSSLEELDPVTLVPSWRYFSKNPDDFRVPVQGSVQRLHDDRTLVAYENSVPGRPKKSWAKLIDREGRELWSIELSKHTTIGVQGAYSWPVEEFLNHVKR